MKNVSNFMFRFKRNSACKTFIIAEAGVHHNGSLERARELISAAALAGADAIKFQIYKAETLVTQWAPIYWKSGDDKIVDTQYEYFMNKVPFESSDYNDLCKYASELGILFCSTPFDLEAVKLLEDLDVPFWKVASADIDNYPLLEAIARTNKPILLSTGASYFREVQETLTFLKSMDVEEIALLHCNLAYPTQDYESNLSRICALRNQFANVVVGYSDHTIPDENVTIPVLAVALGAQIVEKHFTLDRNLLEDDHYHSVDSSLLRKMIKGIQTAEDAISNFSEITQSEIDARNWARRSIVAMDIIPRGSIITEYMITSKRPGGGISPKYTKKIVGRVARKEIERDQQIKWDNLE